MAAVSQKIPNLLGGVSQQPDPVKLPGQVREADNVYLDPTFGCRKRPGTEYVATLGSGIPETAKWFSIFRDNSERYVVAIYTEGGFKCRVWSLDDGQERTVTISSSAASYFSGSAEKDIEQITIADYTMITNNKRTVTMNGNTSQVQTPQALVTIDQISYNSNYSIDLGSPGGGAQKVYSATGLEVIPGSYEVDDKGTCDQVDAQNFSVGSGLNFRLVNQCSAYLGGEDYTEYKVNDVETQDSYKEMWKRFKGRDTVEDFGDFQVKWHFSYDDEENYPPDDFDPDEDCDDDYDDCNYDYPSVDYSEVRGASFSTNRPQGTRVGDYGTTIRITGVTEKKNSNKRYISRYETDVILQNGGQGIRKGQTYTVSMKGRSFTVRVTGERYEYAYNDLGSATFTTPTTTEEGVLSVGLVTAGLTSAVNGISGFTAESVGNVIKITRGGSEFNLGVRGGTTNRSMTALKGTARDVSELPTQGWSGYNLKVVNTDNETADDYYVTFTTEAPGIPGAGNWTETVAPGVKTTINSSTMPHALVRNADGSFTLDALNSGSAFGGWAPRGVGDAKTNPEPSFVGRTISNMFFYMNRLGFLSEDAVIMSQPGDYFNFFSSSALTVSDVDPIDLTASSTTPAILKSAIGSPKGLVLFAERSQFRLSTDEVTFAAATVKLVEISNYFYKSSVLPLNSGVSITFISEAQTYSKVMEMAVDSIQNRPVVADITRVIPEYLPPNFTWGSISTNNNLILYGDGSNKVYAFKFFNNGEERQLAGWTRWIYADNIMHWSFEDDICHVVTSDGTRTYLSKAELIDDPDSAPLSVGFSAFSPRLDYSVPGTDLTTEVVDIETSSVTIPLEHPLNNPNQTIVLMSTTGTMAGTFVRRTLQDGATKFLVDTDMLDTGSWVVGQEYVASIQLPAIFTTAENKADRVNIPVVEFVYLDLYYSGRYRVEINRLGYPQVIKDIEVTPANVYDANEPAVAEIGVANVPVMCPGNFVKLTVTAPDPYPSALTGYSWQGHYNNRGVRPLS